MIKHAGKVIFVTVASGIGLGIGGLVDANAGALVGEHKELVAEAQARALTSDNNYTNLKSRIGESCLSFLDDYAIGVGLENTPEDSVVSDLLRDPDLPCTDQPNVVREHVRAFQNTNKEDEEAKAQLAIAKQLLKEHQEKNKDSNYIGGLIGGFVVGNALLGLGWFIFESGI